ncbi:MAG: B12-binding domain-containing radical SAM protein [Ardenticatenales bacterium]|nr:B12-binding domain-containing radical SAM protein [Ardenticatenales bacterium]
MSHPLRILLLSPRGPLYRHRTGIWKKSLRYMPLTLPTLAGLVPQSLNAEITLLDEGTQELDLAAEADLVGISAITGTAPRAYEIAAHFRRRGIPVVLGGVHPTLVPDEAARHADAVVVGYAEESWPQLLQDFVSGQMKERYNQRPGLSLANLPPLRRDLMPQGGVTAMHTIEATRGCIHHCDFCVVPTAWGRPLQRPVGEVVAEIRAMGAKRLIFLDLNLIADLPYARELFTALIPLKIQWGGLATTLIARDEALLDLAARSGCRGLLIGFETLSEASLAETHKGFNLKQDYFTVVRRLHDHNIAIMGTFVFGFDEDNTESFARTVEFVQKARIDLPRYAIQTPFPATPLYRRLKAEGRILTEDWTLYDGQHVVYQPRHMSPEQLLRGTEWAWKQTYSYRSIAQRLLGARKLLPVALAANLGYRFYAHNLHKYYNCEWMVGQQLVA